ncbi:MAG: deoxyribodipyrimidine photo-lyase [Lysobacterales bacterium]|jgi:deoxyribodipyrimidine photo-lyase
MTTPELVWFKRDLRVADHSPLAAAAKRGAVLCLYIYEPEIMAAEDFSRRHLLFINDSLRDLDAALRERGARLLIRSGDAVSVLSQLHEETGFKRIRVHQETTNGVSFERDRRVMSWAREADIEVVEYRQQGVVRRLSARDGWARQWQAFVASPLVPAPRSLVDASASLASEGLREPENLGLEDDGLLERQAGGETRGAAVFRDFLKARSRDYIGGLSSPALAWESCSRISPYLAYGNLSLRTVHQRVVARRRDLQRRHGVNDAWSKALRAYEERLAWHCHFIQKLEDEPRIEFENMNRAFDGLREEHFNEDYFAAWKEGRTGYPMVDACMRALIATGWINFRMRAMLISFAAYHLWLHWRKPALHLARCFVDYEPGIHYSQIQMQAGTDGISTLRIYSPTKQAQDQDPEGHFIRRWVPELVRVPNEYVAEPHRMPADVQASAGCKIGRDYPAPIVDHLRAYGEAKRRMYSARKAAKISGESDRVFQRHGSRRRQQRRGQV